MNRVIIKLFKSAGIAILFLIFTELSFGQSIIDLASKSKGKRLVKKITAIELRYDSIHYVPLSGCGVGLQIIATLEKGKIAETGSGTAGDISWEFYSVEAEGGVFDKESGILMITDDRPVRISATLISAPDIHSELVIDPLKIKEIRIESERKNGDYFVNVQAILNTGRMIGTTNGMLPWGKLNVEVKGADFSEGKITLPENDHRLLTDDKISIKVVVKGQEELTCSLDIPVVYDETKALYFNGERGRNGQNGQNGSDGASGKAGSGDRAGGDGGNGLNGSDGSVGGSGSPGENLEINVGIGQNQTTGQTILKVEVKSLSTGKSYFYKIDPLKGKLNIYADGGNGGTGGSGGRGGSGGSGGSGSVSGKAGNGGHGGNGAQGGDGGNGGQVTIYVHPSAKEYLPCITVQNKGGLGGNGGSAGSGGSCPNNCKSGENGKGGNYGRNGIEGKVSVFEKEVVF